MPSMLGESTDQGLVRLCDGGGRVCASEPMCFGPDDIEWRGMYDQSIF
jgi:hypothetical protein